jgi:hypothetical protein
MKKTSYFWAVFWIVVNLLIWGWTSGFIPQKIFGMQPREQPVRNLEQINPEGVQVIKDNPSGANKSP